MPLFMMALLSMLSLFSGILRSSCFTSFSALASEVTAITTAGIPTNVHSFMRRSPRRALRSLSFSYDSSGWSSDVMYVYRSPRREGWPDATREAACVCC